MSCQKYDIAYWQQICPHLNITQGKHHESAEAYLQSLHEENKNLSTDALHQCEEHKNRILKEGYTTVTPNLIITSGQDDVTTLVSKLALGITCLKQHGWAPTFILIFDESWELAQALDRLQNKTSSNLNNMDMLAWHIDPNKGESGFTPHRDRQPEEVSASFRADGTAKYTTSWVALTEATPENSCLYVIPADRDPGYHAGDNDTDPLRRILLTKDAYQHIRAVPLKPGHVIMFTHRIMHWGSTGRRGYPIPRIAFSVACSDDLFEAPYFDRKHLPQPPFVLRRSLAAGQMLCYHERFCINQSQYLLYRQMFECSYTEFSESYRKKVAKELVAVAEEAIACAQPSKSKEAVHARGDSGSEDLIDDALDAMLSEAMGDEDDSNGQGTLQFHDDFDESTDAIRLDSAAMVATNAADSLVEEGPKRKKRCM